MSLLLALLVTASPPRSVELAVASTQLVLEGPLLVRLTQEGFTVYPKDRAAALRIRVADLGTELRVEVEGSGTVKSATIVRRPDETAAGLQLEVTQKAVELAHAAAAELELAAAKAPPPAAPPPPPPPPVAEAPPGNPWVGEVRLDLALLSAPYLSAGPLVQLGFRFGKPGLAAHAIVGLMPPTGRFVFSGSGAPVLRGPSVVIQAGAGYRFAPVWLLEIEPLLMAGYARYDELWSDLLVSPGLMLGVRVNDWIHMGLRVLFGVTIVEMGQTPSPPVYAETGAYVGFQF